MNNSSTILDRIIGDANAIAQSNIALAQKRAEEIINTAKADVAARENAIKQGAEGMRSEYVSRRGMVANIDVKKAILKGKTDIIDAVFAKACDVIRADKRYAKYLEGLIAANAEDGETVIAANCDKKLMTKDKIAAIAKKRDIKLTLSAQYGDFEGGVVISAKNCDKNLTLNSILKQKRDELELSVADILFSTQSKRQGNKD